MIILQRPLHEHVVLPRQNITGFRFFPRGGGGCTQVRQSGPQSLYQNANEAPRVSARIANLSGFQLANSHKRLELK